MRLRVLVGGLLVGTAAAAPATDPKSEGGGKGGGKGGGGGSQTRILMSGEGSIMLGTVRASGAGIDIKLNHSTKGIPSWVAFRAPDTLFALDEAGTEVRSLSVDLDRLAIKERQAFAGSAGLVHLALTQGGKRMLGAAYGNGSVDVWDVADAGAVKQLASVRLPGDKLGPNKERQDKPHPHQVVPDGADGRFVAVPDLGTDSIHILAAQDDGGYALVNHVPVEPAGCGPRHGAFYPPGPQPATHFLVLCELKNLINVYAVDRAGAGDKGLAMTLVQSISSFGPGVPHPKAAAGELALGPDGKDVYVSNRLTEDPDDHIAHFRVSQACPAKGKDKGKRDGAKAGPAGGLKLEFVGQQPSHGQNPRMFSLTGDGALVLVANGKGESGIWGMARNKDTGELTAAPLWNISMSVFSGKGPQFVQQIR
ncbi:lactonase, 7-bladed beta-propeller domain-containing protein [Hirsutella rhossiliensis]